MRWIFVNLPVADLAAARAFYAGLGFGFDEHFSDERTASVVVADNVVVMLLTRDRFADFLPDADRLGDPSRTTTVLNALSAGSREEADDLLARALPSGGRRWMPAQDHGSMSGVSFTDPDGHVWEVVWMDPAVLP
ncbi:VOC family protein [Geodermatophilus sp. DSM 44513]|uniref:VOC family protein n=1 Tax=Geodermatophilus sp. DSM 44513 TaxID=1528104 RepID=UPI00126D7BE5|nr:VOC family protein [Geodermatophilus sp. DSM 44513]WNV75454.1 VOC family protein [Geodermatophilus sp. DSM 44513]